MKLVEKHIVKPSNPMYNEIDKTCFLAKNLYNKANYIVRQEFIETSKLKEDGEREHANWIRFPELDKILKQEKCPDYYALPTKVSQQVLKRLEDSWKSFFQSIKDWKKNPEKYTGRPSLPNYKHKTDGRAVATYTIQSIYKKQLKDNIVKLSKTDIKINTKVNTDDICQARIIPLSNGYYQLEVVYKKEIKKSSSLNPSRIAGVDLGVDNLASVTSNVGGLPPILINGRPLKSLNRHFNKKKAKLQSLLHKDQRKSKQIAHLYHKRKMRMYDYMHKASNHIVNHLVNNDIGTLIIGINKGWKQKINIGKKNNQSFCYIPFHHFIHILTYKCELVGIKVIENEESYTSICSFIDFEPLQKSQSYKGRRLKRGIFKSANGTLLNADCNGSGNIIRKVFPNAFADGIGGVVVRPVKVTINKPYKQCA